MEQISIPQGPRKRPSYRKEKNSNISEDNIEGCPPKSNDEPSHEQSFDDSDEEVSYTRLEEDLENKSENDENTEFIEEEIQHSRRSVSPTQKVLHSPKKTLVPKEKESPPGQSYVCHIMVVICLVMLLVVLLITKAATKKVPAVRQSCKNFLQLNSTYPTLDNSLWATLVVGVERALNDPGEPTTFIFLYNSSSIQKSLLMDVVNITSTCFGNQKPMWRFSNDFNADEITQNTEVILDQYRESLKSHGVLVVHDLDQVPPKAANIFFTMCDTYEPLVRKAAIFFTIDISQKLHRPKKSPTAIAEGILKDLWQIELNADILDPLVVRLTENVFKIE